MMTAKFVTALCPSVETFGTSAWVCLFMTWSLGLLQVKFRARWADVRLHYTFAVVTLALATIHARIASGSNMYSTSGT